METAPEGPQPLDPELLADAAAAFGMLAATSRLQIVWLLADGPRDVGRSPRSSASRWRR
ncbi:hypothetical protein [Pseudonocardia sp. HH130629-09]|uniref:hypothetical protein n=1 Tax=Pseudonocardia sp. HH130629-09 TaxID=1641402 RepID=UPI000A640957|nr:hypothetical protein [Pseudonocardia sp. HH130629-09]